jgi:predicted nucleotidyltransferase
MNTIEDIQRDIIERISHVEKPYKVFLFGSYAYGHPNTDSDLDLLVVLDKDTGPRDFRERSENYLSISRALRDIERKIPMDLIVYTKSEFERFTQLDSQFSRKVLKEGKSIL